jgi:hypothetical protein
LEAPAELIVTVPLYVPEVNPVGFADTLNIPVVVPPVKDADSHVPPDVATVYGTGVPPLLTEILCDAGVAPPCCVEKLNVVGESESAGFVAGGAART